MGFEVDFLAVGQGERSGDAIAVRFGNLYGTRDEQTICVIDGGTKESGQNLVDHIKLHYGTERVNYVFSTHPDSDHASGLTVVIESLECDVLVMHEPWNHSSDILHLFDDPKLTPDKLTGRMQRNLYAAHELKKLASSKGINIIEPFAGVANEQENILVLGPDKIYYQSLLPDFRDMPELAQKSAVDKLSSMFAEAVSWVGETLTIETLQDPEPDDTSAENRSSLILLLRVDGQKLLFTGDASAEGLERAVSFASSKGILLSDLNMLHVPHHGSKRNLGPTILNKVKATWSIISASKEGAPKHPSKRITNALRRRGSRVYATQGSAIVHQEQGRRSWGAASEIPFYSQVEDD